ncbi:MAG: hypothetical protein ACOWWR_13745 [Eubacteriales bacterium]
MADKAEKLKILINHLIGHNEDHAQEIVGLAETAKELGSNEAHDLLLQGVDELRTSNISLKKAFDLISKEM